jgi:hypothetical protein
MTGWFIRRQEPRYVYRCASEPRRLNPVGGYAVLQIPTQLDGFLAPSTAENREALRHPWCRTFPGFIRRGGRNLGHPCSCCSMNFQGISFVRCGELYDARCAMALTRGSVESARRPRWVWFFAAGTAAVLIAIIAAYVVHAPLWFVYLIMPASMLMFDPSPADLTTQVFRFLVLFGGAFLLYGVAGWFVGNAIQGWLACRQ